MTLLVNLVILVAVIAGVVCNDDITVGELPEDVRGEFLAVLNGTLQMPGQCPPPQEANISFLLYTRNNHDNPITLDPHNPSQIDPTKKIILLIHGWISGATSYGFPELKDAYLKRYDCNLIILDWSKIASQLYTTCYCEVPNIAKFGANFLCTVNKQLHISLDTIHIVGHSMGGELSGHIGKLTVPTCGETVGRITGLDPAGALYQDAPPTDHLNATDAVFVDVIHTNAMEMGYWGNMGDADFHVNCGGILQPGCPVMNASDILNTLVSVVGCSHFRALDLMVESVNSDDFIAKSCRNCPKFCKVDVIHPTFAIMGENCPTNLINAKYWIPTAGSTPYAKGCTPYPLGCSEEIHYSRF